MIVLDVRKEARNTIDCEPTVTVGELIRFLRMFDESEPIMVGSSYLSDDEGWCWYSSINWSDFKEVERNEIGDIVLIGNAL